MEMVIFMNTFSGNTLSHRRLYISNFNNFYIVTKPRMLYMLNFNKFYIVTKFIYSGVNNCNLNLIEILLSFKF